MADDVTSGAEGAEQAEANESLTGASLLNREDGGEDQGGQGGTENKEGQEGKEGGESKQAKDGDPASLKPDKPEGYELSFDKGVNVDQGLLASFKNTAHELGLNQGQAQKLAALYAGHVAGSAEAANKAQLAALTEAKKGWESEITARPGFKQEVMDARRTLKEFGSEELCTIMDDTLLGSHPVFFDFMVKVGKALAEPGFRGSGGSENEKPLADRLWPGMK